VKNYCVQVPFTGYFEVVVDAENEEEAKNKAFSSQPFDDEVKDGSEVVNLEFQRIITEGNVLHAPLNEIYIQEI